MDDWDARAYSLGGTSNSLLAGFTAKLAEHAQRRRRGDGAVNLSLPVSDRGEGDVRANALAFAEIIVDPACVTTDLGSVRAAVKHKLKALGQTPDEALQLLPLTPLTPKRAVRRLAEGGVGMTNCPWAAPILVISTQRWLVRTEPKPTRCLSGWWSNTPREQACSGPANSWTWRLGASSTGLLTVAGYQPDRENSKSDLRQLAARALAEFELVGAID